MAATSIDCKLCEFDFVLGKAGECDDTNTTCICPDGFSGVDDWFADNTCHVNTKAAFAIHIVLLIFTSVGTIVSAIATVILCLSYKTANRSPGRRRSSLQEIQTTSDKIVKYRSIVSLVGMIVFNVAFSIYHGLYLQERSGDRYTLELDYPISPLILAVGTTAGAFAYFMLLTVWYYSLPSVEHFGALMEYDAIIVKYPNFFPRATYTFVALFGFASFFVFLVLPVIIEEKIYMKAPTKIFVLCLFFVYGAYITFVLLAIRNVNKTFSNVLESLEKSNEGATEFHIKRTEREIAVIANAIKLTKYMRRFQMVAVFGSMAVFLLWMVSGSYYQYFYFSLGTFGVVISYIFLPPLLIFTANGGLKPKNGNNTTSIEAFTS